MKLTVIKGKFVKFVKFIKFIKFVKFVKYRRPGRVIPPYLFKKNSTVYAEDFAGDDA